jgi:ribosomal protein L9
LAANLPSQQCRFKVNKKSPRKKQTLKKFPRIAVILREDVENLGVAGQEVLVKRGHARNNLLLKGDKERAAAVYATPESRKLYKTVFPITDDGQASAEALSDALQKDITLSLTTRIMPFYSQPSTDRLLTASPVTLDKIHNSLMSRGLHWLFYEQLSFVDGQTDITKFGMYPLAVNLAAGPFPVGNSTVQMMLDVRLKDAPGLTSRKRAEQARNDAAKEVEATPATPE